MADTRSTDKVPKMCSNLHDRSLNGNQQLLAFGDLCLCGHNVVNFTRAPPAISENRTIICAVVSFDAEKG